MHIYQIQLKNKFVFISVEETPCYFVGHENPVKAYHVPEGFYLEMALKRSRYPTTPTKASFCQTKRSVT